MYDAGTRPESFLRAYAREFSSVEIDSTWYGTPPIDRVRRWISQVPPHFTFAIKMPREITHDARLRAPQRDIDAFVESALAFDDRLEAALIQLPPDFLPTEIDVLEAFVAALPDGPRWALEVRDPTWFSGEAHVRLLAALSARNIALAVSDGTFVPIETMLEELRNPTATHAYVRWLGRRDSFARFDAVVIDRDARIALWADAIRASATKLTRVAGYANNQYAGHSPATIRAVYAALGIPHIRPERIEQASLFD
jgi:uncharacterized protein YecE (DUF72 family)